MIFRWRNRIELHLKLIEKAIGVADIQAQLQVLDGVFIISVSSKQLVLDSTDRYLKFTFLLLQCQCEDEYCMEAKQRIEVCRPSVLKGAANVTASCSLSQLICLADSQCSTALGYYNDLCRSMYRRGRKCSNKCLNSIEILRKQEKAAALVECRCDGNEDYDCPRMQSNLARLCFHKHTKQKVKGHKGNKGENHHKKVHEVVQVASANSIYLSWLVSSLTLLHCFMLKT